MNLKAAAQMDSIKEYSEAIDFRLEAANVMRHYNIAEAVKVYNVVTDGYCNANRISAAARIKKKVAELYEEDHEYDLAAKYYQECFDLYDMEGDSSMQAAKILLKVADLGTRNGGGDFIAAIKVLLSKFYLTLTLTPLDL